MKRVFLLPVVAVVAAAFILASCQKEPAGPVDPGGASTGILSKTLGANAAATVSVFATGLNNPRGLTFGPDGYLYVAEGGTGGDDSTSGQCDQVIPPVGPYKSGMTARISKISPGGVRTTVVDSLPSSQTSPALGRLVSGVADVAFVGNTLYAIFAGAGCSHGIASVPNGVIRVNSNGTWSMIADLSTYQRSHPVAHPEADDFEPDGTWYSMISVRGSLYAVEPNHGEMVRIDPRTGSIRRIIDISASQGHIVPTALAYHGNFFVGNLNTFPIVEGSSKVFKITPSGQIKVWIADLTTVLGVTFDREGRMYVLENTTGNPEPTPGTGMVLRVGRSGRRDTVATGLFLPTALTFGPDGNLYVSNKGFGPPAIGGGEILKITVPPSTHHDNDDGDVADMSGS